jgi:hypothetical protein
MNYIYGDATAAPFRVDYIALLRASIDFAVEHLLCEQRRNALGGKTVGLRTAADAETRRLEELGRIVGKALDESRRSEHAPVAACADAIVGAAGGQVQAAIERVRAQLARDLEALAQQERDERGRSLAALGTMLGRHDLPDTSWSLKLTLQGGASYSGRVSTRSGLGLDAELALEVPRTASSPFAAPARVERFAPGLELSAPEVGGWFSKSITWKPQPADKVFVIEVAVGESGAFKLRAMPQGTGPGWDAKVMGTKVELVHTNEKGEATPCELQGEDGKKVLALYEKLAEAATEARFVEGSTKLLGATLDGDPYVDHEDPTVLVERLIEEIAPTVQEIARRSKSAEELVIKRVTGDSRREEIFVSKSDLVSRLAGLTGNVREIFTPLGLELPRPESRPPPALKNPSRPPPPIPAVESAPEPETAKPEGAEPAKAAEEPPTPEKPVEAKAPEAKAPEPKPAMPPPRTSGAPAAPVATSKAPPARTSLPGAPPKGGKR